MTLNNSILSVSVLLSSSNLDGSVSVSRDDVEYKAEVTLQAVSAADPDSETDAANSRIELRRLRFLSDDMNAQNAMGHSKRQYNIQQKGSLLTRKLLRSGNENRREHNPKGKRKKRRLNKLNSQSGQLFNTGKISSNSKHTDSNDSFGENIRTKRHKSRHLNRDRFRQRSNGDATGSAGDAPKIWTMSVFVSSPSGGRQELLVGELVRADGGRELLVLARAGSALLQYAKLHLEGKR